MIDNFSFWKWAISGLFYRLFSVFSIKQYNFYNNICEKSPSSVRYRDSNPRPLEHESPTITARPGLPPKITYFLHTIKKRITFCDKFDKISCYFLLQLSRHYTPTTYHWEQILIEYLCPIIVFFIQNIPLKQVVAVRVVRRRRRTTTSSVWHLTNVVEGNLFSRKCSKQTNTLDPLKRVNQILIFFKKKFGQFRPASFCFFSFFSH